jgi:hypothetical protein
MSYLSTIDRESFQRLLANAYAVQQSQLDSQSLSAIVELQRVITRGTLDLDAALHLIVHRAQDVAQSTGTAIGLLKGNRLVYRAGSGSAAAYIGRSVTASLVVSADSKTNCEILRVENAEADGRIEAAICRQFGAKSLLILLICHDHAVAGVLEIFFGEAHAFQDSEVRTYRLMAGLVEEAISHAEQLEQNKTVVHIPPQREKIVRNDVSTPTTAFRHSILRPGVAKAAPAEPMVSQPALMATMAMRLSEHVSGYKRSWSVASGAIVVLVVTGLIANSYRRPASALEPSARSTITGQQSPVLPAKELTVKGASDLRTAPVPRAGARAAGTTPRRVRVGENEVDYIKDDVTVRYFTRQPGPHRARVGKSEVAYIGDDVTVRYFMNKPGARTPASTIAGTTRPASTSWSTPANSVPQKAAK